MCSDGYDKSKLSSRGELHVANSDVILIIVCPNNGTK